MGTIVVPTGYTEQSRIEQTRIEQNRPPAAEASEASLRPSPFSLSKNQSNGNGQEHHGPEESISDPDKSIPASSIEESIPAQRVKSVIPASAKSIPAPEPTQPIPAELTESIIPAREKDPSAVLRQHLHPLRVTAKDFDPVDYVFSCDDEEIAGLSRREFQRAVWYHFRVVPVPKRYWATKGNITSPARLKKVVKTMAEQVPEDFRMVGSVYQPVMLHDPDCSLCGGTGSIIVPNPYAQYPPEWGFEQAQSCECCFFHPAPWRLDHRSALER